MSEEFLENAISDFRTMTLESIVKMTKAFNLKDFYSENFNGMAEIVITPNQVITIYGKDSILHNMLIGYISRYITDAKVFNPIISIRCRSEANMKALYPEILRNGFAITEDMNKVLEMFYQQLDGIVDERIVSLQEFREHEMLDIVKEISDIPRVGEDKNIIGISIEEYIKLNKERNKKRNSKKDNEIEI